MYILCTPQNQMVEMLKLLDEIEIIPLALVNLEFSIDKIKYIEQNIDNFDYVILSSPTTIEHLSHAISLAANTSFITVGEQSANKIKQLTTNKVIYPDNGSGRDILFTEKIPAIDFSEKNVLLVKGESSDGYSEIIEKYPKWQVLDIYKKVNLASENKELLKKLLTNIAVKGIIITTSILVDELFKLIESLQCQLLLLNIRFIVIHPKIGKKLEQYGIQNIYITNSSNKNEILSLVRSLDV